jgi:outer membrane protein OmpA-like peptidoglycan-associated protein
VAYALHPVGWLAREVIFRPFSYFASSTETTRSVLGFREPFDYRAPECFSADDSTPDCRSILPFNYAGPRSGAAALHDSSNQELVEHDGERQVYFPDVNFDFNSAKLNDLGRGRAHQIARLLNSSPGLKVVLQGHTDFKGSEEFNERLGMERAESLRQELVALGVSAERLSTVTFGKSQPLLTEQEDWARAVNRRVQIQAGSAVAGEAGGEEAARNTDSSWQVAE